MEKVITYLDLAFLENKKKIALPFRDLRLSEEKDSAYLESLPILQKLTGYAEHSEYPDSFGKRKQTRAFNWEKLERQLERIIDYDFNDGNSYFIDLDHNGVEELVYLVAKVFSEYISAPILFVFRQNGVEWKLSQKINFDSPEYHRRATLVNEEIEP